MLQNKIDTLLGLPQDTENWFYIIFHASIVKKITCLENVISQKIFPMVVSFSMA